MPMIKLKTFREVCGGCPTHYTGETVNGEHFDAYLRHGYMAVTVDGEEIVRTNPRGLDGVCSFDDFKKEARKRGYVIDQSEATYSSYIDDMEEMMENLYKDKVWVKFIEDFYPKSVDKHYKKGERYTTLISTADALVESGYAVIDDETYTRKKEQFEKQKSNQ